MGPARSDRREPGLDPADPQGSERPGPRPERGECGRDRARVVHRPPMSDGELGDLSACRLRGRTMLSKRAAGGVVVLERQQGEARALSCLGEVSSGVGHHRLHRRAQQRQHRPRHLPVETRRNTFSGRTGAAPEFACPRRRSTATPRGRGQTRGSRFRRGTTGSRASLRRGPPDQRLPLGLPETTPPALRRGSVEPTISPGGQRQDPPHRGAQRIATGVDAHAQRAAG